MGHIRNRPDRIQSEGKLLCPARDKTPDRNMFQLILLKATRTDASLESSSRP